MAWGTVMEKSTLWLYYNICIILRLDGGKCHFGILCLKPELCMHKKGPKLHNKGIEKWSMT